VAANAAHLAVALRAWLLREGYDDMFVQEKV